MRACSLALAVLLSGCAPSLPEGRILCAADSDCPPGWHCSGQRCFLAPIDAGRDAPREDAPRIDAPATDGPIDAPRDSGAPCGFPYSPSNLNPCMLARTSDDWTVSVPTTYDTDDGTVDVGSQPPSDRIDQLVTGGPMIRVIRVRNLDILSTGQLTVRGALPLVVLAWGDVTITGTIDVSGLRHAACGGGLSGASFSGLDPRGAGGGGGGGFGASGGAGGASTGIAAESLGGAGGAIDGDAILIPLRGGCPGGQGGNVGVGGAGGVGGAPGGAMQLSAAGTVRILGEVRAGGVGGRAGEWRLPIAKGEGGGGGGSGGAILIEGDAVELTATAHVCANGGGGGGGGCNMVTAMAGQPATCDDTIAASGGSGGGVGGVGGVGAAVIGGIGDTTRSPCGGGGGGGGVGRIRIRSAGASLVRAPGAVVSPMDGS